MRREDRAKQFMPFDAMKGLQEALREREERHSRVEKHDISEEQMEKNSRLLAKLRRGDKVSVECYRAFHDVKIEGRITEISGTFGYLKMEDEKICFEDIYSVKLID